MDKSGEIVDVLGSHLVISQETASKEMKVLQPDCQVSSELLGNQ
jgi:hypothetical protein